VLPGRNYIEQKVHLAHLLFNQFLFYHLKIEKPLNNVPEEIRTVIDQIAEKKFYSPSLNFIEGDEFYRLAKQYHLKSDRWMIATRDKNNATRIYIDFSKMETAKFNDVESLSKLVGLLAHEYGHLVGISDDGIHSLDKVGIYFADLMKNNSQVETVDLGKNRRVRFYTVRTANSTYNYHSPYLEFGGRILMDNGETINDLTPILAQVLGVPNLDFQKDNVSVFMPKFWGLKNLGIRHWAAQHDGKLILSFNMQTSIIRQNLGKFLVEKDGTRRYLGIQINENIQQRNDDCTVRFQIAFDAQNPTASPMSIDALEAKVTVHKADFKKGLDPVPNNNTDFPLTDLKLTMEPQFQNLRVHSGQNDFAIKFMIKVPLSETQLFKDLTQARLLVAPTLSTSKGDMFGELSSWFLVPKGLEILEEHFDRQYAYIVFKYLYDIPENLPTSSLFANTFQVFKLGQHGQQEYIGYLNSSSLEEGLDLKHEGVVEIISKSSESTTSLGKRVSPNGDFIDFKVKSPRGIEMMAAEIVMNYQDELGHQHQQLFKIVFYKDGQVRQQGVEFGVELLESKLEGQEIVVRIRRSHSFSLDSPWLKSYQIRNTIFT